MTSSVIGALRVNLAMDTADFQGGMKDVEKGLNNFFVGVSVSLETVANAIGAAFGAFPKLISENLNAFDELSKTAQKIGIPVEELSKLAYAADLSGVSMEGMQTAVSKLSRNMVEAAGGTGEVAKTFKALGINVKNSDGSLRSSSAVLTDLSDKFAQMPNGAQKTALAIQLLGKSGADLIPMLNGGSGALGELLDEAKSFGLEVSTQTALMAEAVNDNISRVGYAFSGLGVQLTAALAPVLVPLSEFAVEVAQVGVSALQYLPQVAEAFTVVGGAALIAFSPAILTSIGAITAAIGTGMVNAVVALTAVMAANPLGALAVAITATITAVYYFRDEIKQAIGVDVLGVVKDAANAIFGSFVACFNDIKFVWDKFPTIVAAAVTGAVNFAIKGFNGIVNGWKIAINELINIANKIPGVTLNPLDPQSKTINEWANPYADQLAGAFGDLMKADAAAVSFNYLGSVFKAATPAAKDFGAAVGDVNKQIALGTGGGGGAGGGKSEAERYADIVDRAERRIASLKAEQQAVGLSEQAAAELTYQQDLLNAAQQQGITLTDAQRGQFSGLAASMAQIEAATEKMREGLSFAKDSLKGVLSDFRQGLENGKSAWESFGSAALNVLDKIINKLETQLVDALFSAGSASSGGGGGGIFGSLFSGLGHILGFASGGTILPGGTGGIDSQLVMFRKSPNERVDITKPGQSLTNGRGGAMDVRVYVDQNGNWKAKVEQLADSRIVRAAPSIVNASSSRVMPTVERYQSKVAGDYRNG